ncbi:hypothetical protein KDX26_19435 [Burkholderia cenocepacia]|uniref:hypothetical protein n=1 Tax=Burkholderia cenocepacia TaxID=95486 RepID=UPI001BA2C99E|nr:hypothetical protein [Burkholderia cenocepacia]MBR8384573.1 hypothetical protein [Burkholderia cenocepacia]
MNTAQTYAEAEQETINIIAVLDDDTRQRLYEAEKAYDEATDEWLQDWATEYADARFDREDEEEEWDEAHDEGMDLAQESDEWLPDCDLLLGEVAAQYGVSVDLLGHAVTLMNNCQGWALVEQRRIELGLVTDEDKVNEAVERLATYPLHWLTASLDAARALAGLDDQQRAGKTADPRATFRVKVDAKDIDTAGLVLAAGREGEAIERQRAFAAKTAANSLDVLAALDTATLDRTIDAEQAWCDAKEPEVAEAYGVTTTMMLHVRIVVAWTGKAGLDAVRERIAERSAALN